MNENMKIILIDFENMQNIELEKISEEEFRIIVFIGESQNKIPFGLVSEAQRFGDRLEWIKIDGNGPNALDFHIAYYLGKMIKEKPNNSYIILSKDKGFDPLLNYIQKEKVECKRINSILEIVEDINDFKYKNELDKILENLRKIEKSKLPRKRKSLKTYIISLLKQENEVIISTIVDQLFIAKYLSEENSNLKYERLEDNNKLDQT